MCYMFRSVDRCCYYAETSSVYKFPSYTRDDINLHSNRTFVRGGKEQYFHLLNDCVSYAEHLFVIYTGVSLKDAIVHGVVDAAGISACKLFFTVSQVFCLPFSHPSTLHT